MYDWIIGRFMCGNHSLERQLLNLPPLNCNRFYIAIKYFVARVRKW